MFELVELVGERLNLLNLVVDYLDELGVPGSTERSCGGIEYDPLSTMPTR